MLVGLTLVRPRRDKTPVPPSLPSGVKPFILDQDIDHKTQRVDSD